MLMDFSIVTKRIEEVMEKAEYGTEVYSVELGYEPDYINTIIFCGVSPTLEFIEKFCKLMKVDVMYLFGLIEYVEVEF